MCDGFLIRRLLCVCVCVCVQWMEVGVSGVNGRHAEWTAACGEAGNVPNPRQVQEEKSARAWMSSRSTAQASSAHRVSTSLH